MAGEAHQGTSRGARHLNDDVDTGNTRDEDRKGSNVDGPSRPKAEQRDGQFGEVRQGDQDGFGHPLSFQGEGFFQNGIPFQQSAPHIGMGNAVGYGGRQTGLQSGGFRGKGPKNYQRSDERITDDINEALTVDDGIDASDISVTVSAGEATLSGTVNARHDKRRAEDIADAVSGIKHVQNNLRVNQRD